MFGNYLYNMAENDPTLGDIYQQHMQQAMNPMMYVRDAYGRVYLQPSMGMQGMPPGREQEREMALRGERAQRQDPNALALALAQQNQYMAMSPYAGLMGNIYGQMHQMTSNMGAAAMAQAQAHQSMDPNQQYYSQSSVMSYSNTGNGQPRIYQSSSSTRQGPGGVRETRKAEKDSATGLEKAELGRHIGERGLVIERSQNRLTGDRAENKELLNLDDEETDSFHQEFNQHMPPLRSDHRMLSGHLARRPDHRQRHLAIAASDLPAAYLGGPGPGPGAGAGPGAVAGPGGAGPPDRPDDRESPEVAPASSYHPSVQQYRERD